MINMSLMSLKDCFRAYHSLTKQQPPTRSSKVIRVPYRANNLTRVLQECFVDPLHRTLIIATVSPTPTDVQHTLNSLSHVMLMSPDLDMQRMEADFEIPVYSQADVPSGPVTAWTPQQVAAWLAVVDGGRFAQLVDNLCNA